MFMKDIDIIRRELRYINEILAMKDPQEMILNNTYAESCVDHVVPIEYRHYVDYNVDSLKQHKNRLEQDLEQAQQGVWNNSKEENQEI
jgi:hypothetical protein